MVTNPGACGFVALSRRVQIALPAAVLGLGLLLAPVGAAKAQGYQGAQDAQSACTPDVFRLCSQFIPNRGPIVACLTRSRALLSPECRAFFKAPTRVAKAKHGKKSRKAKRAKRAKRTS
jgi:hypothetical protein